MESRKQAQESLWQGNAHVRVQQSKFKKKIKIFLKDADPATLDGKLYIHACALGSFHID